MKQTAVEWLVSKLYDYPMDDIVMRRIKQAKEMEKEQTIGFGEFIIDELEPMAQNRKWVEERYDYFKSE